MGKAYNMTVHQAAEFVVDVGKGALRSHTGPTDSHWFLMYKEAIDMLDMALRTKGQDRRSVAPGRRVSEYVEGRFARRVGYGRRKEDFYDGRERFKDGAKR